MTEYFHPDYPKLYRIGGEYAPGLARLFVQAMLKKKNT
jgi:hypothetical protein